MNGRDDAGRFLRSRRDRITPHDAGVTFHGQRRVPGLRRGEVAELAGISVEYYTRLERGDLRGVSSDVLAAIARALRLDPVEQQYLRDLSRGVNEPVGSRRAEPEAVPLPWSLRRIIESMPGLPAFVNNHRLDTLAANKLGRALYAPMWDDPASGLNAARWGFLHPAARDFYLDWESITGFAAGALRAEAAKRPDDKILADLIDDLSTRSEDFRTAWAAHTVNLFRDDKRLRHPAVGVIDLRMEVLEVPDDSGLSVVVYTPIPGTGAEESLKQLSAWWSDEESS
ncbi:helix-turn-helix domain-containing protein [Actinoplanes sp. LDG1-06]|uniref:Helix-turn-helix domain-containing protein n=1 Tax=Paractinoplanes ovalisporus TaxID=2810368 RepID=A0ABS2AM32_9ACTN|nr:helix-turn-helix transcriptional regulator [Actinoplanes ovalisporus]MBM2620922.1 helix-turn-helix domain-containing protein [Actinoplanes ovalisporus]